MKRRMHHALVAGKLLMVAVAMGACAPQPVNPSLNVPPPRRHVDQIDITRAVLPKARSLGPLAPAVIPLADDQSEPEIRIRVTEETDRPTTPKGKFPGRLATYKTPDGKYVAVVSVGLEAYLPGVLFNEIRYDSWNIETYKAQAVASRTYALFQISTGPRQKLWDVSNTTSSQVWGDISGETSPAAVKARQAVAATRGFVLTCTAGGQTGIFCTFFSSSNGGAEADVFETRGDPPVPSLIAQRTGDFEDISPLAGHTWPTMTVAKTDITRAIRAWGQRNEDAALLALGVIQSVTITKRNETTTRPIEMTLKDTRGQIATMRAEEFRLALLDDPAAPHPPSSFFDIKDGSNVIYLVNGKGHGHGMGMSQWGAQALALRGVKAFQMLAYYYPQSTLTRAW